MKNFKGKVAVITGGASGIGRGLADRCAREGMKIVLADIEEKALQASAEELRGQGATVLAVQTDVSKACDIDTLAQKTLDAFGEVHLLFNNAGISASGTNVYETTQADWDWFISVNLMSVVHGVQRFVPVMLDQNTECHIVNTASILGLTTCPGMSLYNVTKHGVVSLSETLHHELVQQDAKIKVSVLCPGFVNTRIMESSRNRPKNLVPGSSAEMVTEEKAAIEKVMQQAVNQGLSPDQVADTVFGAIREEKFYIITHSEDMDKVKIRMEDILQDRNPAMPPL